MNVGDLQFDLTSGADLSVALLAILQVVNADFLLFGLITKDAILVRFLIIVLTIRADHLFLFISWALFLESEPFSVDFIDNRGQLSFDRADQVWFITNDGDCFDLAKDLGSDLRSSVHACIPDSQVNIGACINDFASTTVQHFFLSLVRSQDTVLLWMPLTNLAAKLSCNVFL